MLLEQPHSNDNQRGRPKACNAMEIEDIEITEQIQAPDDDQRDAAIQLPVSHAPELLLEPVDRGLQYNSLCAQLAFFGGVVGLERHVEIKCGCCQIEDGRVGRVGK